ncbi:MAG: hypothetical protein LUD15_09425, partial [Bacteroides sp.]|nr:hypothetical protein [Bacteroides sp.]
FLFVLLTISCEEAECPEIDKTAVWRIFPKLYLELDRDRVVNTADEWAVILSGAGEDTSAELWNIDFEKYTLLLRKGNCTGNVYINSHLFIQKDDFFYLYQIQVTQYGDRPEEFIYGMVVEKLPEEAIVRFEVTE